jgi:hypothetical protein
MLVPKFEGFTVNKDRLMMYNNQIYVPPNDKLISLILNGYHRALYMAHPGVMKGQTLSPYSFGKE